MTGLIPKKGALAAWVELYAPTSEAPAEAHLAAAITVISAAIGWKAWIGWAGFREPCTVNAILEGRSATAKKSTVASTAQRLAAAAMDGYAEDAQRLKVRSVDHTSERGLLEMVAAPDAETAEEWETAPPPGLALFWDEIGSVLGDPGQNRKGGDWLGRVRTTLMQMTNGRHAGVQTGATKMPAGRCAVSVLGTMTRVELEERVDVGLLRDGFLGRFALIPHNGRTRYMHRPPKWTPAMVEQHDALVTWLRTVAQSREPFGDVFDLLTDDADATRAEWYDRRARELDRAADDDPSDIAFAAVEAFSRLQTTALKVALVTAIAEQWPQQVSIEADHVSYGIQFAELCLEEIIDLAKHGGDAREDRYAQKVVEYLAHGDAVSRTRLLDEVKHKALSREQRWKVVEALDREGQVEIETFKTTGRSRRDTESTFSTLF